MKNPDIQRRHREDCRLYKSIAAVFDGRIDLSERQKSELIRGCYAAALEDRKIFIAELRAEEWRRARISR